MINRMMKSIMFSSRRVPKVIQGQQGHLEKKVRDHLNLDKKCSNPLVPVVMLVLLVRKGCKVFLELTGHKDKMGLLENEVPLVPLE